MLRQLPLQVAFAQRAPLRPARGSPRPGRTTDNTAPPAAPKLRVVDAEVRARYQVAMWADPLMTEVIQEGASPSAPSTLSAALRASPFSQNYWTKELQEQPGSILTTWTRNFIRSPPVATMLVLDFGPTSGFSHG